MALAGIVQESGDETMSVKRFSRLLQAIQSGNKSLRDIVKLSPPPMAQLVKECLNQFEFVGLMAKESLEHAKTHKEKAIERRR